MYVFTSLSNRREEWDISICMNNGRITKKKKKNTSTTTVSLSYRSTLRSCTRVWVCDIGKIRVAY